MHKNVDLSNLDIRVIPHLCNSRYHCTVYGAAVGLGKQTISIKIAITIIVIIDDMLSAFFLAMDGSNSLSCGRNKHNNSRSSLVNKSFRTFICSNRISQDSYRFLKIL